MERICPRQTPRMRVSNHQSTEDEEENVYLLKLVVFFLMTSKNLSLSRSVFLFSTLYVFLSLCVRVRVCVMILFRSCS